MAIDEENADITTEEENINTENKTSKTMNCVCTEYKNDENTDTVPIMKRLRSWPVWLALLGSLGIILNSFGIFSKLGLDTEIWNTVVNAVGAIFIALGVVNNPTDTEHF